MVELPGEKVLLADMPSKLDDYEVLEIIGEGSFAKVSKVRKKTKGQQILVWKELRYGPMSAKEKQMLVDEVNILRNLNHPNIVKYFDRIIDHANRKIYIVQEYCDAGDLASYVKSKKQQQSPVSETLIWNVLAEVASALQHCHRKQGGRILHRDLKPGNIFLQTRGNSYTVKLGDFGLARVLSDQSIFAKTHVGTPYYMSPEQIHQRSYNEQSDIWSLGCIIYEMAMLSPPFRASNYMQLAVKIQQGQYRSIASSGLYSRDLDECVNAMLQVDVPKRFTVEQVLRFPRVQLALKTIRVEKRYHSLKKRESELLKKEKRLYQWQKELEAKEARLSKIQHAMGRPSLNSVEEEEDIDVSSEMTSLNISNEHGSSQVSLDSDQTSSSQSTTFHSNPNLSGEFSETKKTRSSSRTTLSTIPSFSSTSNSAPTMGVFGNAGGTARTTYSSRYRPHSRFTGMNYRPNSGTIGNLHPTTSTISNLPAKRLVPHPPVERPDRSSHSSSPTSMSISTSASTSNSNSTSNLHTVVHGHRTGQMMQTESSWISPTSKSSSKSSDHSGSHSLDDICSQGTSGGGSFDRFDIE